MKRLALLLACGLSVARLCAQPAEELRNSYVQAEACYEAGNIEEALALLERNLPAYRGAVRTGACRLAALCMLALDRPAGADRYIALLLKEEPYYYISLQDPVRFADRVRKHRETKTTLVTASRQAETPEEAPVPVTLITEEMIKESGARCLQDLLVAYVPGISLLASNEEMNIAMRGVYSSGQENILIMQDGQRLNSYITNAAPPDYGIGLEKIRQVEVLRGPASSLYGSVALTAVINIVTKNGSDIRGGSLAIGTGSYGQLSAGLLLGRHDAGGDAMLWFSLYRADGEPVFIPRQKQYALFPADGYIRLDNYSGLPSLDGGLKWQQGNWLLSLSMNYAKKRPPYSMWLFASPYAYHRFRTFDGAGPGYARMAARQQTTYNRTFRNLVVTATCYSDWNRNVRYETAGDTLHDYIIESGFCRDTVWPERGVFQYIRWADFNLGANGRLSYTYKGKKYGNGTLLGGLEWNRYTLYDSDYLEGMNFGEIVRTWTGKRLFTGHEMNINAFFQLKHRPAARWIINAGLRYDYKKRRNNHKIQAFSPRLALIYTAGTWSLKGSYARSFVDAPYYYRNNNMDTYSGGEQLKPEYLSAFQFSAACRLPALACEAECNLFYNRASRFLFTQPETRVYENAGLLHIAGIEFTSRYKGTRINLETNLTYRKVCRYANFMVTRGQVNNVPGFSLNLLGGYSLIKTEKQACWAGLKLHGSTKCYTQVNVLENGLNGEATAATLRLPGYVVCSCSARYRYRQAETTLTIDNLFNRRYECGGAAVPLRQKGRWLSAGISYRF